MPSHKRHYKGNNRSQLKRARKDRADAWQSNPRPDPRDVYVTVPTNKKYLPLIYCLLLLVTFYIRLEAFYQAQLFESNREDYESFVAALRTPLPACVRINPCYPFAQELKSQLHGFCGQKQIVDGIEVPLVDMPLISLTIWYI